MVKLKKYRLKKFICPTCKGNGFVKVTSIEYDEMIHQCWDCDSEGEFYVHQPEANIIHNDADFSTDDDSKLH